MSELECRAVDNVRLCLLSCWMPVVAAFRVETQQGKAPTFHLQLHLSCTHPSVVLELSSKHSSFLLRNCCAGSWSESSPVCGCTVATIQPMSLEPFLFASNICLGWNTCSLFATDVRQFCILSGSSPSLCPVFVSPTGPASKFPWSCF